MKNLFLTLLVAVVALLGSSHDVMGKPRSEKIRPVAPPDVPANWSVAPEKAPPEIHSHSIVKGRRLQYHNYWEEESSGPLMCTLDLTCLSELRAGLRDGMDDQCHSGTCYRATVPAGFNEGDSCVLESDVLRLGASHILIINSATVRFSEVEVKDPKGEVYACLEVPCSAKQKRYQRGNEHACVDLDFCYQKLSVSVPAPAAKSSATEAYRAAAFRYLETFAQPAMMQVVECPSDATETVLRLPMGSSDSKEYTLLVGCVMRKAGHFVGPTIVRKLTFVDPKMPNMAEEAWGVGSFDSNGRMATPLVWTVLTTPIHFNMLLRQ